MLAVAVVGVSGRTAARAGVDEQRLSDGFKTIRQQPAGPWYVINWGSEGGQPQRWEGRECGSDSCVRALSRGGDRFARLSVTPSESPGFYVNAELAERSTGYAADEPGTWEPSPGHPILLEAEVRWSPNHEVDGGGGAQGSSGIWLWNSPVDLYAQGYADFQAIGLSWTSEGSAVLEGVEASVVRTTPYGPLPVWSSAPRRPVDLQEWNEFGMLWSEDRSGRQTVRFSLNGESLGKASLEEPFGALSLELWSDNQVPTAQGIEYRNPTSEQAFDVDRIEVKQR